MNGGDSELPILSNQVNLDKRVRSNRRIRARLGFSYAQDRPWRKGQSASQIVVWSRLDTNDATALMAPLRKQNNLNTTYGVSWCG
jgi:hypothetical protein